VEANIGVILGSEEVQRGAEGQRRSTAIFVSWFQKASIGLLIGWRTTEASFKMGTDVVKFL
jgi:hypothetical protein